MGPIAPDPEVRQVRQSMLLAYSQIAVQGLSSLAAKRERRPRDPLPRGQEPRGLAAAGVVVNSKIAAGTILPRKIARVRRRLLSQPPRAHPQLP